MGKMGRFLLTVIMDDFVQPVDLPVYTLYLKFGFDVESFLTSDFSWSNKERSTN